MRGRSEYQELEPKIMRQRKEGNKDEEERITKN